VLLAAQAAAVSTGENRFAISTDAGYLPPPFCTLGTVKLHVNYVPAQRLARFEVLWCEAERGYKSPFSEHSFPKRKTARLEGDRRGK